jgi:hypothetical protein
MANSMSTTNERRQSTLNTGRLSSSNINGQHDEYAHSSRSPVRIDDYSSEKAAFASPYMSPSSNIERSNSCDDDDFMFDLICSIKNRHMHRKSRRRLIVLDTINR